LSDLLLEVELVVSCKGGGLIGSYLVQRNAMQVIPLYLASTHRRIGHAVLDAVADELAASFGPVEGAIPQNIATYSNPLIGDG
jgi:hypothetical protein